MNQQLNESLMNHNKEIEISFKILLQLKEYTEQENIVQIANLLMAQSEIIREQQNQLQQTEILCKDQQEIIDGQFNIKQQLIAENQKFSTQLYELQNEFNALQQELKSEKHHKRQLSQLESLLHQQTQESLSIEEQNISLQNENKRLNENNQTLVQIINQNELTLRNLNDQIEKLKQDLQQLQENKIMIIQKYEIEIEKLNQQLLEQQLRLDFLQQQQQSTLQSRVSFALIEDLNNQDDVLEKMNETMQSEFMSIIQSTENNETQNTDPVDEYTYFQKEYCGLKDNKYIKEIIKKDKETTKKDFIYCFSDHIFRINIKGDKSKRIMFITEINFHFFEEHNQHIKITRQFPINKVAQIICCENNPILCCLKIKGQNDDYLIETFKLKDLIEYLTETINSQIQIIYQDNFQIQFKNYNPKKLNEIGNGLYDGSGKQAAFKVSHKQGFLQMQQKTLFGFQDYVEVFALMTDVGILLFKQAGDMHPILFVPCADALIIKNPLKCKPNSFKIKYRDCEYIFHATSQALLDEWYSEFNRQVVSQHKLQISQSLRTY